MFEGQHCNQRLERAQDTEIRYLALPNRNDMKYLLLAACLLPFLADNPPPTTNATHRVVGTIQVHQPYCGGARPTQERARGTFAPLASTTFFVRKGDTNSPENEVVAHFSTDASGTFELQLPTGVYSVLHSDKELSVDAFIAKQSPTGPHRTSSGRTCMEAWYQRPDFLLSVTRDTSVVLTYNARCYTGTNPCAVYNGPVPP